MRHTCVLHLLWCFMFSHIIATRDFALIGTDFSWHCFENFPEYLNPLWSKISFLTMLAAWRRIWAPFAQWRFRIAFFSIACIPSLQTSIAPFPSYWEWAVLKWSRMLCFSTVLLMHFSIPRSASLFVECGRRSLILKRNTPSITESSMNWRHSSNAWCSATLPSFFIFWRFNFLWKLRWRFLSFVKQLRWYLASIEIMSPPEILAIIPTSCKSVAIVFMFESCSKVWTEESCSISCSCSQNMHFSALRHLRLQSLLSSSTFGNFFSMTGYKHVSLHFRLTKFVSTIFVPASIVTSKVICSFFSTEAQNYWKGIYSSQISNCVKKHLIWACCIDTWYSVIRRIF